MITNIQLKSLAKNIKAEEEHIVDFPGHFDSSELHNFLKRIYNAEMLKNKIVKKFLLDGIAFRMVLNVLIRVYTDIKNGEKELQNYFENSFIKIGDAEVILS